MYSILIVLFMASSFLTACKTSDGTADSDVSSGPNVVYEPDNVYADAEAMSPIYFGFDDADLDENDKKVLRLFWPDMKGEAANGGYAYKIIGFTDEPGGPEYNKELGKERAEAVKAFLVSLGADASALSVESMGENALVVDTQGESRHWKNRRVEFVALPMDDNAEELEPTYGEDEMDDGYEEGDEDDTEYEED